MVVGSEDGELQLIRCSADTQQRTNLLEINYTFGAIQFVIPSEASGKILDDSG